MSAIRQWSVGVRQSEGRTSPCFLIRGDKPGRGHPLIWTERIMVKCKRWYFSHFEDGTGGVIKRKSVCQDVLYDMWNKSDYYAVEVHDHLLLIYCDKTTFLYCFSPTLEECNSYCNTDKSLNRFCSCLSGCFIRWQGDAFHQLMLFMQ